MIDVTIQARAPASDDPLIDTHLDSARSSSRAISPRCLICEGAAARTSPEHPASRHDVAKSHGANGSVGIARSIIRSLKSGCERSGSRAVSVRHIDGKR